MKIDELKQTIFECLNDIVFTYNGKQCGITSTVHNYIPSFQVWYGDNTKEYSNANEVIKDKFYENKSLLDLAEIIEFSVL